MNQNSINNPPIQIKNDQSPSDDVFLNLNLSSGKATEQGARTKIFKDLGPNVRTFLGSFCERTAVASLLRKKCIVLLSVFLCSGLALEMKMTMKVIPSWFSILYMCLGYQIAEDIIRYSYLKKTNEGSQKMACLFEMTQQIALMLFLFVFNLKYERIISGSFILLTPLLFMLEAALYWRNPSTSQSQNIVTRLFYILQSSLIAAKMNNMIDLEWKTTLVFLWIYLGINAVYAVLAGLLLISVSLSSIINFDREYLSLLKNEVVGYIWHISYNAFNVAGIILLIGYFGDAEDILEVGLFFAQKLSLFLGVYTVFLFPLLKKQTLDLFQDLLTILQVQVTPDAEPVQKKHALVKTDNQNKKEFFLMISSTYFSLLKKTEMKEIIQKKESNENPVGFVSLSISADENQHPADISEEKKEDVLCYICENNESNAIIAECGHGGVCCDCVVKSVEQKNECMECRKPVKAIYKIENNSETEGKIIVQASEFVQVLEA